MHIRNEPRPTQPTKPNTNRVKVSVAATTAKPQPRHADRILNARAEAVTQPAIAAAVKAEALAKTLAATRSALHEAESELATLVVDDEGADAIAAQKVAVAKARAAVAEAEAAK